jgi:hypothetical protein
MTYGKTPDLQDFIVPHPPIWYIVALSSEYVQRIGEPRSDCHLTSRESEVSTGFPVFAQCPQCPSGWWSRPVVKHQVSAKRSRVVVNLVVREIPRRCS